MLPFPKIHNSALIIALLCLAGCNFKMKQSAPETAQVAQAQDVKDLVKCMDGLPKEDAATLYKLFSGLADYLSSTDKIHTTVELVQVVGRFETDYHYVKGGHPNFTAGLSKFLEDNGYKTPKTIADNASGEKEVGRTKVIADMSAIASALRAYMKGLK